MGCVNPLGDGCTASEQEGWCLVSVVDSDWPYL